MSRLLMWALFFAGALNLYLAATGPYTPTSPPTWVNAVIGLFALVMGCAMYSHLRNGGH